MSRHCVRALVRVGLRVHVASPRRTAAALALAAASLLLAACGSKPPQPDWQMNAHAEMQRTLDAYLSGDARVEALASERARSEIARTGRLELMARAELMRCAARTASLVFEACGAVDALQADAAAADAAYARYLAAGAMSASDLALLPAAQRPFAAPHVGSAADAAALQQIEDPLSRLVAAAVLLRAGQAHPAAMAVAADTASAQGWRRPLLAWLKVQLRLAQQGGDNAETQRLQRRIDLVQGPSR